VRRLNLNQGSILGIGVIILVVCIAVWSAWARTHGILPNWLLGTDLG